jgi:UDP-N-acetylmuramoyl-tripeptide--D-alanyl-D-alanine ligase
MMMTLAEAHALLPASRLVGSGVQRIGRVHSDTRSVQPGDLFVAIRGERFDAHDFLAQAASAGAVAALAERGLQPGGAGSGEPLPGLLVADSLQALQALATAWRGQYRLPVVAVTGSNGKTTVTQMIGAIFRAWLGDAALATRGNFNNHIGLPLSVLRLRGGSNGHRAAVFELGMNHPGEIALLAGIAQPTVAVVNNAQREHQEFMHSVEAVARENGAVLQALPADGTAVFPADDAHAGLWQQGAGARRVLTFTARQGDTDAADSTTAVSTVRGLGRWHGAQGWALHIQTPLGPVDTHLRLPGLHNLHNAVAAATAAVAAGAPLKAIAQGLASFEAVKGRSHLGAFEAHGRTVTLVDDSYNANADSVRAAIDLLAALPGPRWLVLGDMGEVGEQGPAMHAEVGRYAAQAGIEHLWCVGSAMQAAADAYGAQARRLASTDAALQALGAGLAGTPRCASALVKGSRFMEMERFVAALHNHAAGAGGPTCS